MKTTKKGFTLIELIVVIAIIGVLAAILVPSMLGYVKKSKVSSANSTASSVYKAINSALTELDEEGVDVGGTYQMTYTAGSNGSAGTWATKAAVTGSGKFATKVANFFSDIVKVDSVIAQMDGGACVALACASDSTYTGTYPGGVVTTDTYKSYSANVSGALAAAISQNNITLSGSNEAGTQQTS